MIFSCIADFYSESSYLCSMLQSIQLLDVEPYVIRLPPDIRYYFSSLQLALLPSQAQVCRGAEVPVLLTLIVVVTTTASIFSAEAPAPESC